MFDLGWTELLVIGIVALIVVGPKDLPMLFRNVGRFVGRARGMAREFSTAMNDAADQSGMNEISKGLKTAANPIGSAMDHVKDTARSLGTLDLDAPEPPENSSKHDPDSETGKLAAQRAEQARKIQAATARAAAERKAREAAEALAKADAYDADMAAPTPEAKDKA